MIKYNDVKDFIATSDANTSKNISSETFTFSQGTVTMAAGTSVLRSYTIPLSADTRLYQIYVNLSIDGDFWTPLPARDRDYSNFRRIAMNLAKNGSSVTLDIYHVNMDSVSRTFAAMDIKVNRRDFVDEM